MVNIKVPINLKGAIKFSSPDIDEFIPKQSLGDLQFTKNLLDEDRILLVTDLATSTDEDMNLITPENGTTFYLLGASIASDITVSALFDIAILVNNDLPLETALFTNVGAVNWIYNVKYQKLVGDGVKNMRISFNQGIGNTSTLRTTIYGYLQNSVRP